MKEKISRNKISSHYKSFFELENMALAENDNLMIDWCESLIIDFVNQEVENRIKERMPNLDDLDARLTEYLVGILDSADFHEWLLSSLTNDSQKTEGGEG